MGVIVLILLFKGDTQQIKYIKKYSTRNTNTLNVMILNFSILLVFVNYFKAIIITFIFSKIY